MNKQPQLTAYTLSSALGHGLAAQRQAIQAERSGLRACDLPGVELDTWIGRVPDLETVQLPSALSAYDCRNNRLAWLALHQDGFVQQVAAAVERYGSQRVGIFMGTSTSGIAAAEQAYAEAAPDQPLSQSFNYQTTQNIFSCGDFVARALQLQGPVQVISTACSSSAKVFAAAWRHMQAGWCDAAVVGGVDSLCQMTLYGFNSLQLVSSRPCRPADSTRDGLSIGEAAGFALLEWARPDSMAWALLGYGESSDAHHMSSPHPEGRGAVAAMRSALQMAVLDADVIDYVNLHGTATPANDLAEDRALMQVFGSRPACSSTKGFTGHTLGAAGIAEAVLSCVALEDQYLPPSLNTVSVDQAIHSKVLLQGRKGKLQRVMSNSFGFGGNNISLIFGAPG